MRFTGALIALMLLGAAAEVSAQALPTVASYAERAGGRVVPAGHLVLDGRRMSCGAVPTVLDPGLNDYAASYRGFIILNSPFVARVATPVKFWIFHHECGHQSVGRDEIKADCYAVQRGRREGWLDVKGLDQVCEFISASRADAMHLGGPLRCTLMRQCYMRTGGKPRP